MLIAICEKLRERCPLKHSFLRALQAFDPSLMAHHASEARTSLQSVTRKLAAAILRTAEQCDAAERQFGRLVREQKDHLQRFDSKTDRLDEFLHSMLADKEQFLELWQIIRLVLILSHGQAPVERSFSVNDDILLPNMKEQTLCAMKIVYDVLHSLDIKIHEFAVSDKMLQYCRYVYQIMYY